ncbi:hypothetical protein [Nitrospira sp. Nam80]
MVNLSRRGVPVILTFILLAAGCAQHILGSGSVDSHEPPIAIFVAEDYAFEGPDSLPAGPATVRIHNHGHEPHHIQLLKLTEGKTVADLAAALQGPLVSVPEWAKHMGGPNGVSPGGIADARVHLEAGTYALICMIPSKSGIPHVALGMTKELRVTEQVTSVQPQMNHYHLAMRDYEFVVVQSILSGRHSFYVKNRGTQPHQVSVVRLDPNAKASDILAAFEPDAAMAMPGRLIGGMTGLEPGREGSFTIDLPEGRYAFICLFPNPSASSSHARKGMVMNFTIK